MTTVVNGAPVGVLALNLEQLQAISNGLHGRGQVRFDPDNDWTALKLIDLMTIVDTELATLKAELALTKNIIAVEAPPQI
jgi:hypothetical protein